MYTEMTKEIKQATKWHQEKRKTIKNYDYIVHLEPVQIASSRELIRCSPQGVKLWFSVIVSKGHSILIKFWNSNSLRQNMDYSPRGWAKVMNIEINKQPHSYVTKRKLG